MPSLLYLAQHVKNKYFWWLWPCYVTVWYNCKETIAIPNESHSIEPMKCECCMEMQMWMCFQVDTCLALRDNVTTRGQSRFMCLSFTSSTPLKVWPDLTIVSVLIWWTFNNVYISRFCWWVTANRLNLHRENWCTDTFCFLQMTSGVNAKIVYD